MRTLALFALLLTTALVACAPQEEEKDGDAPPINQDTDTTTCEGTPPVIAELDIVNGGLVEFDIGPLPTVQISVHTEDDDGDIDSMRVDVWWDATVDGTVNTAAADGENGDPVQFDPQECSTNAGTYNFQLAVDGDRFAFDTEYEFAAIAYDAHEEASELAIASGYTPKADGSDGG
jgi:hypothetical protein